MRLVFLPALLLLFAPALAGGVPDPVTKMGRTVLSRSDLVAAGIGGKSTRIAAGPSLSQFTIQRVLFGAGGTGPVALLAADGAILPVEGAPAILFLRALSRGRYEVVERVDLTGADAAAKEAVLRSYLEVEAIRDRTEKRAALRDLLLGNLAGEEPFARFAAAREIAHFTEEHGGLFTRAQAEAVAAAARGSADPLFRELLEVAVGRMVPPGGEAPPPDGDGADPGAAEEDPRLVPPEYRALRAEWDGGVKNPARRLEILRSLAARHLSRGRAVFVQAIGDPDARVRETGALQAAEAGAAEAVAPLLTLLGREKDKAVLRAAIAGLGILGAEAALDAIEPFGADPDLTRAVAEAAARIGGERGAAFVRSLRGRAAADAGLVEFLDFLLSDGFREQEAALRKVREARRLGR